jgi:hypothetical protein
MEISCITVDVSWFPNMRSSEFSDILAFSFIYCLSARLWNIITHKVSINHRLTHIHCLLKMHRLLFSWALIRSIIHFGDSNPPPLHYKWSLSGFHRYLHYFECIYCSIPRINDIFIISECVCQIICNILQIYYFLNLQFSLFYTWVREYDGLVILIYFLAFWMVLVIFP